MSYQLKNKPVTWLAGKLNTQSLKQQHRELVYIVCELEDVYGVSLFPIQWLCDNPCLEDGMIDSDIDAELDIILDDGFLVSFFSGASHDWDIQISRPQSGIYELSISHKDILNNNTFYVDRFDCANSGMEIKRMADFIGLFITPE